MYAYALVASFVYFTFQILKRKVLLGLVYYGENDGQHYALLKQPRLFEIAIIWIEKLTLIIYLGLTAVAIIGE